MQLSIRNLYGCGICKACKGYVNYTMTQRTEKSADRDRLSWTVFPMRERPAKGVLFWAVIVFTVWAVYWNVGSVLLTIAAAALLLGSLTSFYLPTCYTLDEGGAGLGRWFHRRRIGWERIRSVSDEKDGLFLSPFPVRTRLENFRGLFLPYRSNHDEVLHLVRRYAPAAAGLPLQEKSNERGESTLVDHSYDD